MTHDSLIRSQSGRMSPAALALAIGLHVLVATALWWASPLRPFDHAETPIMISIEPEPLSAGSATAAASPAPPAAPASPTPAAAEPKAAEAPPAPGEPPQQAALAPSPPAPAPIETPAPPPPPAVARPTPPPVPTPARPPTPPSEQATTPAPSPAPTSSPAPEPTATEILPAAPVETATTTPPPASEAEAESAWQTDASSWKPQVTLEPSLATPPRSAQPPYRPAPRPPTTPRTAQLPGQRLQDYPPPTASLGGPSSSSFESTMAYGGERNDYLSRVYRHIEPYRDYPAAARASGQHGRVVTRVTIDRAGGLIDIRIDHSSGWPLLDNAEMAAIRRAVPLPPVPDGMRGDPVVLVLNMNY